MITPSGTPILMASGTKALSAAACEFTNLEINKSITAYVQECSITTAPKVSFNIAIWLANIVSAIQDIPKTATIATMPDLKMSFLLILLASTLQNIKITEPARSIKI